MELTWYGQSCFTVRAAGKQLLFDPFISGNPKASHIDVDKIEADYILVSHGHGDHVADLVRIAKRTGAQVIAAFEVVNWAKAQGVENVHGMNFGSYDFPFGRVSFVPAWHSSALPDGSYGGNPGGFVVQSTDGNFYYSGDTSLMMDMQLIPHYARVDFAVMPIGGNFTMDARDAVKAAAFVEVNKVVGVHYDTFEVITIDKEASKKIFSQVGKELLLPEIGETIQL